VLVALCVAVCACAVTVAPASAARLDWRERAFDGRVAVLRFLVTRLTVGSSSWSAQVSLTNLSRRTISVGDQFGVALYPSAGGSSPGEALLVAYATAFAPRRPHRLQPGATWSGAISGRAPFGASSASRYARVVFGPLRGVPGEKRAIFWITNHRLEIPGDSNPLAI
jgi:hypothetical protein